MSRAALKLVESQPFYRKEVELPATEGGEESHSLHLGATLPQGMKPQIAASILDQFSRPGDVVLDPFCRSGAVALEAVLRRRVAFASDTDPLAALITSAKLEPADITEVALRLQMVGLKRLVPLNDYERYFSPFYDVNTYRELHNLRAALLAQGDSVSRFIQFVAIGLLHGHSAGYFSAYTFPQIAISPQDQVKLNIKRKQSPDYRPVAQRILRKTSQLMRDGFPSVLSAMAAKNKIQSSSARNLAFVGSAEVDLVVTSLPSPGNPWKSSEQWLKNWFLGLPSGSAQSSAWPCDNVDSWRESTNETLLEMARVVGSGGRATLEVRNTTSSNGREIDTAEELLSVVQEHLSRFWDPEGVLEYRSPSPRLRNSLKPREEGARRGTVVVLRRR